MKQPIAATLAGLASISIATAAVVSMRTPDGLEPKIDNPVASQTSSTTGTTPPAAVGDHVLVQALCPRPAQLPPPAGEIDETDPALGPVYVSGDSALALTKLADLALHAGEVVVGRVADMRPGRTTDWYGFAEVTVDVESSIKGAPSDKVVFEQAVCDRQTGRAVIVEGQLADLRSGDDVLLFLNVTDPASARYLVGGIGIFRVQDDHVVATSRDAEAVRDVEGRRLDDIRQLVGAQG